MTLTFKYGFTYKGLSYGWNNQELYRLPTTATNGKYYGLKKLSIIKVGNHDGYRVNRDKLSINRLKSMTVDIDTEVRYINDKKHIPS